ncbi:MAG: LysR substrate-binding domain-containing protein [Pseudomonadota bacterium]
MARNLPPLNALRAFEAAGRLGSFTRAAAELNVSHSAISRHVRGLEARLNVHLFAKTAKGVELTEPGRTYLARLTPVFDEISDATEDLTGVPSPKVTLTSEQTIVEKWLIPRLQQFEADCPQVDLVLLTTQKVLDIEAHDADMALRYFFKASPQKKGIPVFTAPFRPYGTPDLARKIAGAGAAAIAEQRLIPNAPYSPWEEWFEQAGLSGARLDIQPSMNAVLAIASAAAGNGIVLMTPELVQPEVDAGRLVPLSDIAVDDGGYYLVINQRAGRRRNVRTVRDWLLAQSSEYRQ